MERSAPSMSPANLAIPAYERNRRFGKQAELNLQMQDNEMHLETKNANLDKNAEII